MACFISYLPAGLKGAIQRITWKLDYGFSHCVYIKADHKGRKTPCQKPRGRGCLPLLYRHPSLMCSFLFTQREGNLPLFWQGFLRSWSFTKCWGWSMALKGQQKSSFSQQKSQRHTGGTRTSHSIWDSMQRYSASQRSCGTVINIFLPPFTRARCVQDPKQSNSSKSCRQSLVHASRQR